MQLTPGDEWQDSNADLSIDQAEDNYNFVDDPASFFNNDNNEYDVEETVIEEDEEPEGESQAPDSDVDTVLSSGSSDDQEDRSQSEPVDSSTVPINAEYLRKILSWLDIKNTGVPTSDIKYNAFIREHNLNTNTDPIPSVESTFKQLQDIIKLPTHSTECCSQYCVAYSGRLRHLQTCPECGTPRRPSNAGPTKVTFLDPTAIYSHRWRHPGFAKLLNHYIGRPTDDHISDVWDGELFHTLNTDHRLKVDGEPVHGREKHFTGDRDTILGLATDGIGVFSRQTRQGWPIIIVDYSIPPEYRWKEEFVIFLGVIPGRWQILSMSVADILQDTRSGMPQRTKTFLEPIVDLLEPLHVGVELFDAHRREFFQFRAHLSLFIGDMPAIAKVMGGKGHGSVRPCRACLIGAIKARNTHWYVPFHPPTINIGRWLNQWSVVNPRTISNELREHIDWLQKATDLRRDPDFRAFFTKSLSKKEGIAYYSPFLRLSSVRVPLSFPFDSMHAVLENVAKNLIRFLVNDFVVKNDKPYLDGPAVREINKEIKANFKHIPSSLSRNIYDISQKKESLTADHVQDVIQLYAPVVLRNRIPDTIYQLFIELRTIWNTLKMTKFDHDRLARLDESVYRFLDGYERCAGFQVCCITANKGSGRCIVSTINAYRQ